MGIHGEGALPYWKELQTRELSCQGGCGAVCVRLSPVPHTLLPVPGLDILQDQHKKCCREHSVASSSSSSARSGVQQD